MTPNKKEFLKLAQNGNVIPVYEEFLADTETPVSAFLKVSRNEPYAFLLESVEGEEKIARYSFVGVRPRYVWKSRGRHFEKIQGKKVIGGQMNDPFYEIEKLLKGYRFIASADLPRFQVGLVGYLAYDLVRFCERIPDKNPDPWGLPDTYLMLADQMVVFDHAQHKIRVVANAFIEGVSPSEAYQEAADKIKKTILLLKKPLRSVTAGAHPFDFA